MLGKWFNRTGSILKEGRVYVHRASRNPLAWVPFLLILLLIVTLLAIVSLVLLLTSPLWIGWQRWRGRAFRRRFGTVSDAGIRFPKASDQTTIVWSDIQEVVLQREPAVAYYRITYVDATGGMREYVMPGTGDDEAFERELQERQIPFQVRDFRTRKAVITC